MSSISSLRSPPLRSSVVTERVSPKGCIQKLCDLVARIGQFVANCFRSIFCCSRKPSTSLSTTQRLGSDGSGSPTITRHMQSKRPSYAEVAGGISPRTLDLPEQKVSTGQGKWVSPGNPVWQGAKAARDSENRPDRTVGLFAALKAISVLGGTNKGFNEGTIDRILDQATETRNSIGNQSATLDLALSRYKTLSLCPIGVAPEKFEVSNALTLNYDTVGRITGNQYKVGIEERILSLLATARQNEREWIGAVLFKGSEGNEKAYGVIVDQVNTDGPVYYLFDPYGTEESGASLHRFRGHGTFANYFKKLVPAPANDLDSQLRINAIVKN